MNAIHQLVAGYARGDAISHEARALRQIFRRWGARSEIYSEVRRILPELRNEARDVTQAAAEVTPDDVALLHLSIGSPVNAAFAGLPCRKALLYHNITPPEYFRGINEAIARTLAVGREQMRALAGAAGVNLAVSAFNARELEDAGYRDVRVFPFVCDRSEWDRAPDRAVLRAAEPGATTVLFVGRGVPNKRIEDLLAAHYYLRTYVDPTARFVHVGSYAGTERYRALLDARVRELRLPGVVFAGSVPQAALNAYYRAASVFLCLSEHEGFCVPLFEAMHHGVPVVAHAAAAVPETLDGAGVLVREKRFDLIAELIGRLAHDDALRNAVVARQRERSARFFARDVEGELRGHLMGLLQ